MRVKDSEGKWVRAEQPWYPSNRYPYICGSDEDFLGEMADRISRGDSIGAWKI